MKNRMIYTLLIAVILALVIFNVTTVRRVSERPGPVEPPVLNDAPVRVYGIIEPAGKEVVISPVVPGVVRELFVSEGDTVSAGERLCVLENDAARAQVETAAERIRLGLKAVELSTDEYRRNRSLLEEGSISEAEYMRLKLKKELDEHQVDLYRKEYELARERLEHLSVTAPTDGIVYLCDIRAGEQFHNEGPARIIMGSPELQVRCDVEVIWIDSLDPQADYEILNAETGDTLGTGRLISSSRYLRPKRLSTEDPEKRLSTSYQEVIFSFEPVEKDVPVRLPVMVHLSR